MATLAGAMAGCGGGGSNAADVNSDPVNNAPVVTVSSPTDGAEVETPGTLEITATASDTDGNVVSVQFFVNGTSVGTDSQAPFAITVTDLDAGDASITAVARDNDGASTTSSPIDVMVVANTAPQVALATPEADQLYVSPGAIPLRVDVTNGDPAEIQQVEYFADGNLIATATGRPDFAAEWQNAPAGDATVTAMVTATNGQTSESTQSVVPIFTQGTFAVEEVELGDPDTCYGNPEFSDDGRYMVWFERTNRRNRDGTLIARMWHCEIDPDTGDFVPPDCRGFTGFDTTLAGRAYIGRDATGVLYVGANENYQFTMVRPTGATSGEVTVFDSLEDNERRGIYPSVLPDSNKVYLYWLKSIGDLFPANADTVELRAVDLDDPANEIVLSSQDVPEFGLAPMDITFPRWSWQQPVITYGEQDDGGVVEVFVIDVTEDDPTPVQITDDGLFKVGQFPIVFNGDRYLASGVFPTTNNVLYREPDAGGFWEAVEFYRPPAENTFSDACQAASNEPFVFGGRLFTTYQIASCFDQTNVFFTNTSEVWFTELLDGTDDEIRLSQGGSDIKNEPEPLVGTSDVWVYYTRYPLGDDQNTACFNVIRTETPLNN